MFPTHDEIAGWFASLRARSSGLIDHRMNAAANALEASLPNCDDAYVVGSTARGWLLGPSDVDIIAITDDEIDEVTTTSDGLAVGISRMRRVDVMDRLQPGPATPSTLRLASSLSSALPLRQTEGTAAFLLGANNGLRPDPALVHWYLAVRNAWIAAHQHCRGRVSRIEVSRVLQINIFLVLLFSPFRVIKHRWNLMCLRQLDHDLFDATVHAYDLLEIPDQASAIGDLASRLKREGDFTPFHERALAEALQDAGLVNTPQTLLPPQTATYVLCLAFCLLASASERNRKIAGTTCGDLIDNSLLDVLRTCSDRTDQLIASAAGNTPHL